MMLLYLPMRRILKLLGSLGLMGFSTGLLTPAYGQATKAKLTEVPVLCYHQVRNYRVDDGTYAKAITVTPSTFASHMKMLHDSGYSVILPGDLYAFFTEERKLPAKPILLTFDDNTSSQFSNALPVLNKYGFRASFFVMTVTIGKQGYMTKSQLKQLWQEGHTIGSHTWDHKNMRNYVAADWKIQLDQPLETLQKITGQQIAFFAYPYGSYTAQGIQELRQRNIRMAFILHTKQSATEPLLTVRRMMVLGSWSSATLAKQIGQAFNKQ